MKKIFGLLAIFAFVLTSCTGDQGPIGPEGPQGPEGPPGANGDGTALVGQTVQYDVNYDYIANDNLWSTILDYSDLDVKEGDAVLAYLQEQVPGDNGTVNVWSQLPLSKFTSNGTIQYSFNHNTATTELLINGDYNLSNLDNSFVSSRVVRIVIVPSNIVAQFNGDFSSINKVMGVLHISENDVQHLNR